MANVASAHDQDRSNHRLSVTLSAKHYAQLTKMASNNRVSLAWVVREAIERLLRDERPLIRARQRK
ncbi:MAG: ribbon-helix-helix protein, CopG family [Candidatus Binatia bacterium]